MSENLNRSNQDFSKYDSMSIGELEEILRADAMSPERDNSDVDEILYIMEVLAKKRRQNGIAGKTALEAYQEFQQHYLPVVEEESKTNRKSNIVHFRRFAAVAASLVLVFSLSATANAFSFRDVWNAVVNWAQETFSFSVDGEASQPFPNNTMEYDTFQDVLIHNNIPTDIVPSYIPSEYVFSECYITENPTKSEYLAVYSSETGYVKISVKTYARTEPEQIEQSGDHREIYVISDTNYHIFSNNGEFRAAWINGSYECYVSGDLTIEQIKLMIDSVGKG